MIFFDYEKVFSSDLPIRNKYILTTVVARRARQISEQKGQELADGGEKAISKAARELLDGKIYVDSPCRGSSLTADQE